MLALVRELLLEARSTEEARVGLASAPVILPMLDGAAVDWGKARRVPSEAVRSISMEPVSASQSVRASASLPEHGETKQQGFTIYGI